MAITAALTLSPTTINALQTSLATITISNSAAGGPNVPILGWRPLIYNHNTTQVSNVVTMDASFNPAATAQAGAGGVPAGGSVVFTVPVVAYSPRAGNLSPFPPPGGSTNVTGEPNQLVFDVTCEIIMGDGTTVIPAITINNTLTVNSNPFRS